MSLGPAPSTRGAVQRRLQCMHSALSSVPRAAAELDLKAAASSAMAASTREASDDIRQPRMHSRELDGDPGPDLSTRDIELFKENGYLVKRNLLPQAELQVCLDKFWAAAPESIRRDAPESWVDPARHDDWATETPPGYERGEHNRGGTRWTAHALGHDEAFLAATARHPDALRVVEALIGGPVKLPGRNRGIYAIFPTAQDGSLGPHVDSHTFECQMVTYLGPVGDNSGGFTVWPGSHQHIYRAHDQELNWVPNDSFPSVVEHIKATIKPVQMTGDIGDCIFTHHRILHSAGVNRGKNIRLGVFTDYQKVRPPAPIAWKANGSTTLVNGGFSKYELGGGLARHPPDDEAAGSEVLYSVPWWDDNLEFAPTHPPCEDMWDNWNLGKKPVQGDVIDTTGSNWQDWLPVPVPMYSVPPVPSGHGAMINKTVLAQLQQRKD